MARRWLTFFGVVHPVLSWRRWWRFWGMALMSCAIALLTTTVPIPASTQAQTNPTQVQQGQQQFEAGEYADAVEILEAAIATFADQNQPLQQAITLSNLALVHQALAQWEDAETALNQSFALLDVSPSDITADILPELDAEQLQILAAVLNVYGKGMLQKGDATEALAAWQQASRIYEDIGDRNGQISSQINQIQALQSLGLFQQAKALGEQIRVDIEAQTDPVVKSKGLLNLGNIERAIGNLNDSVTTLEKAQQIADPVNRPGLSSSIALSLGATQHALGNRETERFISVNRQGILPWICVSPAPPEAALPYYLSALDYYEQAASFSLNRVAALLNRLAVFQALNEFDDIAWADWQQVQQRLPEMRASRSQVFAQIALARRGACIKQAIADESLTWDTIRELLSTAVTTAQSLNDPVAESYALGNLGGLYEYFASLETPTQTNVGEEDESARVWRETGQKLTEQALLLAQPLELPDISYRWQWQLGRLQKAAGNQARAIAHYRQAAATLKSVRNNLLTIDSEVQFSFRDNVEPVYRELADLLLSAEEPSQDALKEVIGLIDSIQLAELESFLQCNLVGTVELTQADIPNTSAVLYTIILADRLEVIVQLPDQTVLQHHRVRKVYTELEVTLTSLRRALEEQFITDEGESIAVEVYDWLLQPQEDVLESSGIDTLVFVLDGALKNIPPAALRDAEGKYLVEKYAIALTPRLQLQTPQPLKSSSLEVSFFGLAEIPESFRRRFGPLPFVNEEAQQVDDILDSRVFLNDEFTSMVLSQSLQNNPSKIVHFATHGEFSSDPESTYILSWDKQINSNELNSLLQGTPADFSIELLVLSACKTANGDNRAALGLAGLALQAGAESTVASLWTVNDAATADFVGAFYEALTSRDRPISRAEALRTAQLKLLREYEATVYWAPFVLVGNWL